eukprot:gene7186-11498_t
MPFGQIVIGPPGSGKSTFCHGMFEFLKSLGRKTIIVNLDSANEILPYEATIDIKDLVSLEKVMTQLNLGPNGSILYCMEYLCKNLDWLKEELERYDDYYILFDFPGQIELFTVQDSVRTIMDNLQKWNFRLTAVHLIDSHYCSDPFKFISAMFVSLSTMIRLELPHVNVLSKIDLIESYGKLNFDIEYYTEAQNLSYLVDEIKTDHPKFLKLNEVISEFIEDFSLLSFSTLNIQDKKSTNQMVIFLVQLK